ncbi:penicillin-binding protein PBP4 [Staphylococcus epidermidis]|jgi:penicillin-binding protein 4|nr:penicillin-binding protein PBP4 [Staphylococcus epidermidis]EKC81833.1 penicillin binding protein 4 [Staphylococcus epidermidis AU12-03]MBM0783764.1 D-alanyl-D-alanine carboxypeptidase [Staphylococcus epidermidis]MBM0813726.1 D-alanyl-D-alanine carboxypeptidase [Staphylococcus epidermidis]MBM5994861.1 D-alanyl-D-alanine carboxypeptidase [Staphylococcus epidermidis]MBM6015017.1 D-alanyl-D-alanine carboxypeptidase [Staphylococcus epidermidis]
MKKLAYTVSALTAALVISSPLAHAIDEQSSPVANVNKDGLDLSEQYNPKGMIVTNSNGQILYNYHGNTSGDPASMTKLMTLYLTFDALEKNQIRKNQTIKMTDGDEKVSTLPNLSTFKLKKGQNYTVDEIIKQMTLASSNPATLILGRTIYGDTSKFTDHMNEKAKSIGMTHTHFTNPSGAPNELLKPYAPTKYQDESKTKTTSEDMSILVRSLLKKHPDVLQYTKLTQGKQYNQSFETTNLSLKGEPEDYKGTDGLKTGTSDEGYSLALTNNQNNLRLNAILLDVNPFPSETTKHVRNQIANHMIDDLRKEYVYKKVVDKGVHKIDGKKVKIKKALYDTVPKDENKWNLKMNDQDQVYVSYPRHFIKGSHVPKVDTQIVGRSRKIVTVGCIVVLVVGGLVGLVKYKES